MLRVWEGESSSSKITTSIALSPAPGCDLLQLAGPHVYPGRRLCEPLGEAADTHDIGRFGQKFQFVEVLRSLSRILSVAHDRDEHRPLALRSFRLCNRLLIDLLFRHSRFA